MTNNGLMKVESIAVGPFYTGFTVHLSDFYMFDNRSKIKKMYGHNTHILASICFDN